MKQQTKGKKIKSTLTDKTKKQKLYSNPDLTDDEKLLLEIRQIFNMSHEGHNFNIFLMMKNIKAGVYVTPSITYKKGIIDFCKKYNLYYNINDIIWDNNTVPTKVTCFISTNPIPDELINSNHEKLQHEAIGRFLGYECIVNIDEDTNLPKISISITYNFNNKYVNDTTPPYYAPYGFVCHELTKETLIKLKKKRKAINKIGKNFPTLMPGFKCSIKGQFNI